MPFTFFLVTPGDVNDPNGALVTNPGGESNAGAAALGDTISFNNNGSVVIDVNEDEQADRSSTLSNDVTVEGTTFAAGSNVEADYGFVGFDSDTGLYHRIVHITINNTYVGAAVSRGFDPALNDFVGGPAGIYDGGTPLTIIDPDPVSDTTAWETFVTDNNYNGVYSNDIELTTGDGTILCYASGTLITLADGEVAPVEMLTPGEFVQTLTAGPMPVRWVGRRKFTAAQLDAAPNLRPVRIRAGALGKGLPENDLLVSPQHRMLVSSRISRRMLEGGDCLIPAKRLVGLPGIEIATDLQGVEYVHVLLDGHHIMLANGAPSESLLTGPMALAGLSEEAKREIEAIFPEVMEPDFSPVPAREIPEGRLCRRMVDRHIKNGRDILESYDA